jgi:hypothetical protein
VPECKPSLTRGTFRIFSTVSRASSNIFAYPTLQSVRRVSRNKNFKRATWQTNQVARYGHFKNLVWPRL